MASHPRASHHAAKAMALAPLALCCAAQAQPELFFGEYKYLSPRISAMALDGSNPHLLFSPPSDMWLPLGLAFDAGTQQVYWLDSAGASEVARANLDGTGMALIGSVSGFARGLGLDAQGRFYFSSNNTVQRMNADGSGLETIYTSPISDPVGSPRVDATNGHVYVGANGSILRMDLDGSNVKTVTYGVSTPFAIGLDVAQGYLYWIDGNTQSDFVGRVGLDGSGFTVLVDHSPNIVESSGLTDLLVDPQSGNIFYTDSIRGQIFRAGLDGQSPATIYTSPAEFYPSALTLSTGEPVQPVLDCNGNGIADDQDIAAGAPDCDNNGVIDTCQANPCPDRTLLLDNGSDAANNNGRSLGWPSEWQIFQPFEVPAGETWTIGELGLDGYTVNYADGLGLTVRLFPDDGTFTRPDETQELASTTLQVRFDINNESWVYAPLSVTLEPGFYWARIEANNPVVYGASINYGLGGLPSMSRGSSGNFTNPASPIALRFIQGDACPADFDGNGALTLNDFVAFRNAYTTGDLAADFDGNGSLTLNDFVQFRNAYVAGCP